MTSELFRLSEDEAALVQHYRGLSTSAKAILLLTAELQAEQVQEAANNVVYFSTATKIK